MNRRAIVFGSLAAIAAPSVSAGPPRHTDQLRVLIDTVILHGDMTGLADLVTTDVAIPDLDIHGIDAFRIVSESGFASRESQFREYRFDVVSIAESGEWAHAFVRVDSTTTAGQSRTDHVFYVARFTGDLISELYLS